MSEPLYAERDAQELEPWFSRHLSAMTGEALHSKSDIACELAFRDAAIAELKAENRALSNRAIDCEMSWTHERAERAEMAIAELVQQLKDERDAWEDLRSNSVSIDGWLRRFAARRIGAINKVIDK